MTCLCEQLAGNEIELTPTCIGHIWMFKNLQPEEFDALSTAALRRKLSRGEPLFLQGDSAEEMFLIKGGRIKLSKVMEDGTEMTLDIRKAGDVVGENLLSEEADYPVSAICMEDTLACGFSRLGFEKLVMTHPNIGLQIIRNLSEQISWLTSRAGSLAVSNIEDRLYQVLSSVAIEHGTRRSHGVVIQFPLTHEDLSFLIGAHRVSITRAMKTLKDSGKVRLEGRHLVLPMEKA